ncbi:MAG TPA: hypothetical protein VFD83_00895 [Candidatus Polarisedimenticolia bacterium]|nr:hypothetical protein [Candidatus Polarisedimenticolia bacterium]
MAASVFSVMIARTSWNARALRSVLGLVVFACWLGGALFHFHEGGAVPDCKVCQALQANQADLPSDVSAPDAPERCERLSADSASDILTTLLLAPQGRAPPLA